MALAILGFFGFASAGELAVSAEELIWSGDPGCHERVLRRRHHNPLFPVDRREVTAIALFVAQEKDRKALKELRADVLLLAVELPEDFPFGAMAPWRERIDDLRARCASVGGDSEESLRDLDGLRAGAMKAWRTSLESIPDGPALFEEAERLFHENEWMMMNEEIAQIRSCMPSEDMIPSILTYDLETLHLFKRFFGSNAEVWYALRAKAIEIAKEVWDRGEDVPGLRDRVAFLAESEH